MQTVAQFGDLRSGRDNVSGSFGRFVYETALGTATGAVFAGAGRIAAPLASAGARYAASAVGRAAQSRVAQGTGRFLVGFGDGVMEVLDYNYPLAAAGGARAAKAVEVGIKRGVESARSALKNVIDFTAELSATGDVARARLRSAIGLRRGDVGEAHHLIPLGLTDHEVVKRAAQSGFNFNGEMNGLAMSFDRHRGINIFHHEKYNNAVRGKLDRLFDSNPNMLNDEAAALLQAYAGQLRSGISKTTGRLR